MTYINQASLVEAGIDDALLMRLALLSGTSGTRQIASAAVDSATDAVRALGALAARLVQAAGSAGEGERLAAEATAYFALDDEYRSWLKDLRDDSDSDPDIPWQCAVRRIVQNDGQRLVEDAGDPAWLGREVNGQWLDTQGAGKVDA